jgi:centromeric protein E
MVVKGYEDNLGSPLRAVREDVEREWGARVAAEETKRKETDAWATELARALEKEKKVRTHAIPSSAPRNRRKLMDWLNR